MQAEPFKVGDIVRYGDEPHHLFKIEAMSPGKWTNPIYWGRRKSGWIIGDHHEHLRAASKADLELWKDSGS